MCAYSVTQSFPSFCDHMDCNLPGSSVHGVFQAKILAWVAISYSRGPSWPRDGTRVSWVFCTGRWMRYHHASLLSLLFSHSVMSDSLWLMDCSTPGLPVHQQLLEFTQIHGHSVGDAIQPSHPLSSPSPPSFNLSQHQGLFKYFILCIRWPKYWSFSFSIILPMNIQDWSPLGWTGLISLQSKGFSRALSNTTVQKHQFFGVQLSLHSNSHIHTWLLEQP